MTRISFLLCSLCECSSSNIFYGYLAYFPTRPSAPRPDLGGGKQAAPQNITVMKGPSGVFGSQPFFFPPSACVCVCVGGGAVGAVMIFPGQAQVGVQVYSIYVCVSLCWEGWKDEDRRRSTTASFLHIICDSLDVKVLIFEDRPSPCDVCLQTCVFCPQYVCMAAGLLKAPGGGTRGKRKARVGRRI